MNLINPIIPRRLFEVNPDVSMNSFDDEILIMDNFYKNYDEIYEFLSGATVDILNDPGPDAEEWSRNFVDYYQCRPSFFHKDRFMPNINAIKQIIKNYYSLAKEPLFCSDRSGPYEFNFFKFINIPSQKIQAIPHLDFQSESVVYNSIVYLDRISSGGTAIYANAGKVESLINDAFSKEHLMAGIDVSSLKMKLIRSKPNRLVVFKGNRYHNGYIESHRKYQQDWRISQVMFFKQRV